MAKRIVTKMGDIFCVEIDNGYKRFFQYIHRLLNRRYHRLNQGIFC